MNLTDEQIDHARQIVSSGGTKLLLEQEFDLSDREAYRLFSQLAAELELQARPELLDDVKFLIEEGESRFQIKRQLGFTTEATDFLISKARAALHAEDQVHEESAPDKVAMREAKAEGKQDDLTRVRRMLSEGYGRLRIRRETGMDGDTVDAIIEEIRAGSFVRPRMFNKNEKVETVERIKQAGGGAFHVARALDVAPGSAQKTIKRVEGKLSIADDSLKMAVARGTTVMTLQNRFGFRTKAQVMEAIHENFPHHFIYQKEKHDGDVGLWVIPDKDNVYDFCKKNAKDKLFRTSVSEDNNFMFVQMLPEFDGDHIKLYNLTDVHVGHKDFREELFREHVQMIADDPCAFVIWGGDMFEWAHKMSVGEPWEQIMSPMQQVSRTGSLLQPVAHKTWAYRSGNHDQGRGKLVGADLAEALANMLGVPYFNVEVLLYLDFTPARLFSILLDHGHSGGAIASILRDTNKFTEYSAFPVHAHFSGHVHNSFRKSYIFKEPNIATMKYEFGRMHTIVGGSYLGYTGTYAERAKYAPTPQDLMYFQMNRDGSYKAGEVEIDPV